MHSMLRCAGKMADESRTPNPNNTIETWPHLGPLQERPHIPNVFGPPNLGLLLAIIVTVVVIIVTSISVTTLGDEDYDGDDHDDETGGGSAERRKPLEYKRFFGAS